MFAKQSVAIVLTSILLIPRAAAAQLAVKPPTSKLPSPLVLAMVERAAKRAAG
jgi:hypothetical protein